MPQIWCEYPDSNWEAEAEDFKSSMFTNFIILAFGGRCGNRTHAPYHYDDRLAICCITILPIFLNLVRPERIKLPLHRS